MTYGAEAIMTLRGTNLALDRRRRDALATYAENAALAAGVPAQTWVRQTWGLKDYEAKHLLRGDASEPTWERILKLRGPHCGWFICLPIMGAIIGEDLADHFANEKKAVANERAAYEAEEARIANLEAHARERRTFAGRALREGPVLGGRASDDGRVADARLGGRTLPR
jgi:hypothetical protein